MNEPNQKKQVEVVAAIIEQDGKVLCMQRGRNKLPYISLKWEFPGGKIELGESESGALKREIREELDASIEVGRKVMTVVHEYPDFILKMHAYLCDLISDRVTLSEHVSMEWRTRANLDDLDWAAADIPIVNELGGASE